jgi:hypothetical protein
MTITTTSLGSYTTQITLSGETSSTNFINTLDSTITSAGWSQVDVTNPYYRVYNSLNADGSTYKYIGICIDPATLKINTTSYESWNASTHTATNEVWTFNRAGTMGYAMSGCDVIVMASSHWLILQTFIRAQPSCWSGVVELARELPEDTAAAGYPCWAWMSSATAFTLLNNQSMCVSLPRTRTNLTGINAALNTTLQSEYGRFGTTTYLGQAFTALAQFVTYGWNNTKKILHGLRPVVGTTEVHGRMFGMKATYNIGSSYNSVSIPIDSNFNYSSTGTNANHWVLAANPSVTPNNLFNPVVGNPVSGTTQIATVANTTGYYANQVAVTCNNVLYYTSNSSPGGVWKSDVSGTAPTTPTQVPGIPSVACWGIVYDNVQYMYVATPSGVYQINTLNNDSCVLISTPANVGVLYWDGTYLWASNQRAAGTNGSVYQINVSTLTIINTIVVQAASGYIASICSDFQGNTYVCMTTGQTYKIVNSTSAVTSIIASIQAWTFAGIYFNGANLTIAQLTSTTIQYRTYTTSGTLITTGTSFTLGNGCSQYLPSLNMYKLGIYDMAAGGQASGANNFVGFDTSCSGLSYATPGVNFPSATAIYFDGNRVFYVNYVGGVAMYTNVFHGDEQATTYGRFLLPQ